jgi:hypothetical protein
VSSVTSVSTEQSTTTEEEAAPAASDDVEYELPCVASRSAVEDLLDALAAEEWDIAFSYLEDQGVSPEVSESIPDILDRPPTETLDEFCAGAACGAPFTITPGCVPGAEVDDSVLCEVVFQTATGPWARQMSVRPAASGLVVESLPPPEEPAAGWSDIDYRIFDEPYAGTLAVFRHEAIEYRSSRTAEWTALPESLPVKEPEGFAVAGDWVVCNIGDGFAGGVAAVPLADDASVLFRLVSGEGWQVGGAGNLGNKQVAFLVSGDGRLNALEVESGEVHQLLDRRGQELEPYGASTAGDTILVSAGVGDSTQYEVFSLSDLLDGDTEPRLIVGPILDGGRGVLSPDGMSFVFEFAELLHQPRSIMVVSVTDGSELGRWDHTGGETTSGIAYDGRWIVTRLVVPYSAVDPETRGQGVGRLLVIDTTTWEQRLVETGVWVQFAGD